MKVNLVSNIYIFLKSIGINKYRLIVIVDLGIRTNFMSLSLAYKNKFRILINENTYSLIVINRNLLFSRNKRVN